MKTKTFRKKKIFIKDVIIHKRLNLIIHQFDDRNLLRFQIEGWNDSILIVI